MRQELKNRLDCSTYYCKGFNLITRFTHPFDPTIRPSRHNGLLLTNHQLQFSSFDHFPRISIPVCNICFYPLLMPFDFT